MTNWTNRTVGYKLGFFLLLLGSAFYVIGYSAPFWLYYEHSGIYMASGWSSQGLWMACAEIDHYSGCSRLELSTLPGWFKAVQALQCLGLMGLAISCLYGFIVNCCQSSQTHSRFLEVLTGISGLMGFIGVMVYVGMLDNAVGKYYSWGFSLDLTGCIFLIITSIILFVSNKPVMPQTPAQYQMTTPAGGTTIIMQGQSYIPPPAGSAYLAPSAPSVPGAYPQAGYLGYAPPQVYAAQYPQGNVHPQGYLGGIAPNAWHSGAAPPPSYTSAVGYSGNVYPQWYGGQYPPQHVNNTGEKAPQ